MVAFRDLGEVLDYTDTGKAPLGLLEEPLPVIVNKRDNTWHLDRYCRKLHSGRPEDGFIYLTKRNPYAKCELCTGRVPGEFGSWATFLLRLSRLDTAVTGLASELKAIPTKSGADTGHDAWGYLRDAEELIRLITRSRLEVPSGLGELVDTDVAHAASFTFESRRELKLVSTMPKLAPWKFPEVVMVMTTLSLDEETSYERHKSASWIARHDLVRVDGWRMWATCSTRFLSEKLQAGCDGGGVVLDAYQSGDEHVLSTLAGIAIGNNVSPGDPAALAEVLNMARLVHGSI